MSLFSPFSVTFSFSGFGAPRGFPGSQIFEFISWSPIFQLWGTWMAHEMPFQHSGALRKHKYFPFDAPSNADSMRHQMQHFLENCGCVWAVPVINFRGARQVCLVRRAPQT